MQSRRIQDGKKKKRRDETLAQLNVASNWAFLVGRGLARGRTSGLRGGLGSLSNWSAFLKWTIASNL